MPAMSTTEQFLEQMRVHLATETGKELTKMVGLAYQLDIAQVRPSACKHFSSISSQNLVLWNVEFQL